MSSLAPAPAAVAGGRDKQWLAINYSELMTSPALARIWGQSKKLFSIGLFFQASSGREMDHNKSVLPVLVPKKAVWSHQDCKKIPLENMRIVSSWFPLVQCVLLSTLVRLCSNHNWPPQTVAGLTSVGKGHATMAFKFMVPSQVYF